MDEHFSEDFKRYFNAPFQTSQEDIQREYDEKVKSTIKENMAHLELCIRKNTEGLNTNKPYDTAFKCNLKGLPSYSGRFGDIKPTVQPKHERLSYVDTPLEELGLKRSDVTKKFNNEKIIDNLFTPADFIGKNEYATACIGCDYRNNGLGTVLIRLSNS